VQEEILKAGTERELDTVDILLSAKVSRTAITLDEYINLRMVQGASLKVIEADLLKDLKEGGRIFGEFVNGLKPTFNGSINRFRDIGQSAEIGLEGKYRWVAVLVNTCPDCLGRHNEVKTWDEWEADGMPRTGATVCKEYCKCVIIPEKIAVREPIYRK
jgi:hypothetical protein